MRVPWRRKRANELPSAEVRTETVSDQTDSGSVTASSDLLSAMIRTEDTVTVDQAMQIPAFAACVDKISGTISEMPFKLYKDDGEVSQEVTDDYRLRLVNSETGDTLTAPEWKRAIVRDYLTAKGGYTFVEKVGTEYRSLRYVAPGFVGFAYNSDPIFKSCRYLVNGKMYEPYQFMRIVRNTVDGHRGSSVIDDNGLVLSVAWSTYRYELSLVGKGGNKKGFVKSPRKLSQEAIDKLKEAWSRLYSNSDENVVVLNEGLEFQESSNTSVEMQMNENKKTNASDICNIVGAPVSIIQGNATDQDRKNYLNDTIMPILVQIMSQLDSVMLLESEKRELFWGADVSSLVQLGPEKQMQIWKEAKEAGIYQLDEIRREAKKKPLGVNYLNMGLQDVLFDPEANRIIIPNMAKVIDIDSLGEQGDGDDPDDTGDSQDPIEQEAGDPGQEDPPEEVKP